MWFEASLRSGYLPRASYRQLWQQYVRFGRAKVVYWRLSGDRPQRRQRLLLSFPLVGVVVALLAAWRGRLGPTAALGAAGLVAIERLGNDQGRVRLPAWLAAMVGMVCVGVGWSLGVWREAVHR